MDPMFGRVAAPMNFGVLCPWIVSARLLQAIALHASVSLRTLNRQFREHFGTTPLGLLARIRVDRARRLPESTGLTVDRIAEQSGFGSYPSLLSLPSHGWGVTTEIPAVLYRWTMIADLPPVSPFRRHWDGDTRPVVDVDIQGIEHESQPGPPVDDREQRDCRLRPQCVVNLHEDGRRHTACGQHVRNQLHHLPRRADGTEEIAQLGRILWPIVVDTAVLVSGLVQTI
jgi:AraC-like DNA-binding protein